jgi:hypothetical protein
MFIKSNFLFALKGGDREYSFLNQGVSIYGISGLRWTAFDPADHVGDEVTATMDVLAREKFRFSTLARLTAETTADSSYLGMKFYLSDFEKTRLAAAIQKEGYYPTDYVRKYPRIPARGVIASMPLRAIVNSDANDLVAFDIANMSPSGVLFCTENPKAALFPPGMRLRVQIDPRGERFSAFKFEGLVCRVSMEKNPETKNISRYLGIRFLRIPDNERQHFLEILRAVLDNIQHDHLAK